MGEIDRCVCRYHLGHDSICHAVVGDDTCLIHTHTCSFNFDVTCEVVFGVRATPWLFLQCGGARYTLIPNGIPYSNPR